MSEYTKSLLWTLPLPWSWLTMIALIYNTYIAKYQNVGSEKNVYVKYRESNILWHLSYENSLREHIQLKSEVYIHLSQIHLNSVFHNSWILQQASHNNLGEFWPIPPDRAGVTDSGLVASLLARTCFFSSAHKFSMGLRLGLCDGHSNTLTLLSLIKPFCYNFGSMLGVIVYLEDPFATKL